VTLTTFPWVWLAIAAAALALALPWRLARHRGTAIDQRPGGGGRKPAAVAIAVAAAAIVALGAGLVARIDVVPADSVVAPGATGAPNRADLVRHLERSPRDGRGWALLARLDFDADRFADAAFAYERALSTGGKVAADPALWCEYADALGMAQGGSLAGRPRELVMRALAVSPAHPKALEMAGSAAFEAGEFAAAARYWKELLPQLREGTRERALLAAAIAHADERAAR
jgi:cytochrome c-type biogenesis protein CcmH